LGAPSVKRRNAVGISIVTDIVQAPWKSLQLTANSPQLREDGSKSKVEG
jgi:hypothetical protein